MKQPLTLLTQSEAAAVLDRTVRTLASWRSKGIGPAYFRIAGGAIRYLPDDLHSFILGSRIDPAQKVRAQGELRMVAEER